MIRRSTPSLSLSILGVLACIAVGSFAGAQDELAVKDAIPADVRSVIGTYCAGCHGDDINTIDRQIGLTEILLSTLISGMTNVIAFTVDELGTTYTGIPCIENERVNLHDVRHGKPAGKFEALELRQKIRHQHAKLIDTMVTRLKSVREGEGSKFDNSMLFYYPENGETHHSHGTEYPFIVMAGKNAKLDIAGRYIRLPNYGDEGHKTLGNWYTSVLNAYGNPIDTTAAWIPDSTSSGSTRPVQSRNSWASGGPSLPRTPLK